MNPDSGRAGAPPSSSASAPPPSRPRAEGARQHKRKFRPVRLSSTASRTIRPRNSSPTRRLLTCPTERPTSIARRALEGQQESLPDQACETRAKRIDLSVGCSVGSWAIHAGNVTNGIWPWTGPDGGCKMGASIEGAFLMGQAGAMLATSSLGKSKMGPGRVEPPRTHQDYRSSVTASTAHRDNPHATTSPVAIVAQPPTRLGGWEWSRRGRGADEEGRRGLPPPASLSLPRETRP